MRAWLLRESGNDPALVSIARPLPGPGEALIRVIACGLNFADLLMIEGRYQDTPPRPFVMGMEFAGVVAAVGADTEASGTVAAGTVASGTVASGIVPGARVAVFSGQGGLADFAVAPVARCVPLPAAMPFAEAAAFLVAYGTSHVALAHRAHLVPGETLLVLGAAGGVGLTAVEIGKRMGARVIACARGADKLAVAARAGADILIDSDAGDLRDRVRALGGADVVYDPVGGPLFTEALRATNPEGRLLTVGFASGKLPEIAANHLMVKNLTVIGLYWGGYLKFRPEVVTQSLATLFGWYAEGGLRPHISHRYPLEQTADALETLRARRSTGKVVVEIAPPSGQSQ